MDRNLYDNDFEEFLKQKSDQYKMYPSDRVWSNVYSSLHGRKKWWALGFTLFFIGTGLLVGKEVLMSNYSRMATQLNQATDTFSAATLKNIPPVVLVKRMAPLQSANHAAMVAGNDSKQTNSPDKHISRSITDLIDEVPGGNQGNSTNGNINNVTNSNIRTAANTETELVIENNLLPSIPAISAGSNPHAPFSILQNKLVLNEKIAAVSGKNKENISKPINHVDNAAALDKSVKYSRFSLQFYASPTISYRRLSNANQKIENNIPVATGYANNVNSYVRHKPAPGFELGSNVQYKLSNSLTVFAGAQLNYSRYYIDAFKYRTEKASIALNNASAHDTVSGYTDIRNFSGYAPEQLQNKYLQLSIPVGIEIKLLGDKKLQFSVAGGIQPTFLLSSNSYLISSDYKNYIQSPDLARGFNVHTNFEAFISYKAAGLKWQIGPQFRSQLLSSYSNQYRVREYLTEYGIKFGVSRSF